MVHRVAVLADSTIDGDSRAHRVAAAAADAGYEVTLIGRPGEGEPPPGVRVLRVPVAEVLRLHRQRHPRPGPLRPLAYRSAESYEYRNARLTVRAAFIATRGAELDIVHRPLPLKAAARAGHACARLVQAVRRYWTAARSAQYRAALRSRTGPGGPAADAVTTLTRLLRGTSAWRRLDPLLLDLELAYGPVLDGLRPHLVHALGHRALGVAVRAAYRAEGAGHRIEVIWDALPRRVVPHREATARDTHERAYAPLADGVVTVAESYADELRRRHALPAAPTVALNTPPYEPAPPMTPGARAGTGVRAACRLAPDVPLLVHSGAVTPSRGLLTVVEALPKLYDLHAAFVVPDPADPHLLALTARAAELGVARRLHVLPYVPPAAVPAFLRSADIAVLPDVAAHQHPSSRLALPARYFEYAHARLPVVVADARAMSKATLELGNGEVFRSGSTPDFVRAVGAVLTNPRRYRKAYERADTLRQWSWQSQSAGMLDLYGRLLGPAAP